MKASTIKYGVLTFTLSLLTIILALMPFHAFLTVWAASVFDHYTAFRLWKEALVVLAGLGVLYLVCFDRKVRFHTTKRKLTWLIIAYLLVQLVWAAIGLHNGSLGPKAAAYGVLVNSRFLVFFLLTWAVAVRTNRLERRWPKLLLWPAVIVVTFGLAQVFLLPPDFLRHFGYGPDTIGPMTTINHNTDFLRYFSTLRGANALGAYLLLPISALLVLLVRYPHSWNWAKGLLLIACFAMLVFSFSRSAWIGAVLSGLTILALSISREWWRKYWPAFASTLVALAVITGGLAFVLRDNLHFQNAIFHTQDNSAVKTTSNGAHVTAVADGIKDIVHNPLGDGPGSAGPASVYNVQPSRISENYYLQIGQETGLIGIALLLGIIAVVGYILWTRRTAPLSLTLLAALVGISFVGLLTHVWADDTLSYLWWGFAGIAVGTPLAKKAK